MLLFRYGARLEQKEVVLVSVDVVDAVSLISLIKRVLDAICPSVTINCGVLQDIFCSENGGVQILFSWNSVVVADSPELRAVRWASHLHELLASFHIKYFVSIISDTMLCGHVGSEISGKRYVHLGPAISRLRLISKIHSIDCINSQLSRILIDEMTYKRVKYRFSCAQIECFLNTQFRNERDFNSDDIERVFCVFTLKKFEIQRKQGRSPTNGFLKGKIMSDDELLKTYNGAWKRYMSGDFQNAGSELECCEAFTELSPLKERLKKKIDTNVITFFGEVAPIEICVGPTFFKKRPINKVF